jgi:hypothetical protein
VLAPVLDDSSTTPVLDSVLDSVLDPVLDPVLEVLGSLVGPELLPSAVVPVEDVEPPSAETPDVDALTEESDVVASDTVDVEPLSDAVAATPSSEQPTSHATHTTQLR